MFFAYPYEKLRAALQKDQSTEADAGALQHLPENGLRMLINLTSDNPNGVGSNTPYLDADQGANNTRIRICLANARALGLLSPHGNLSRRNHYLFRTQTLGLRSGMTACPSGTQILSAAMTHEIGHVLGGRYAARLDACAEPGKTRR